MEVRFAKDDKGRMCSWTALRSPRTRVPGTTMAAGGDVPHDLATFVIEDALGIEHGFWGCVSLGATFRTLGRKRTPQGTAVIREHLGELDDAERRVNEAYGAWRRGETGPADAALDTALDAWRSLPRGEELALEWPTRPRSTPRQHERA